MDAGSSSRKVLFIVENSGLDVADLRRCVMLCRDQFGVLPSVARVSDAQRAALPDGVTVASDVDAASGFDILVRFRTPGQPPPPKGVDAYRIEVGPPRPRLSRDDGKVIYDHAQAHVFNRLSAHLPKGYIFDPYGFVYRMTGHGPINPFGFRIDADMAALADRGPEHKVVATFGGSTTWSIDCIPSETYTAVLERLLNERSVREGLRIRYTCLNFGQSAYVVLNAMVAFLLHGWRVRPDIVIAHDGWNDLLYGSYVDPYLVREAAIVYACDIEPWAQRIHGAADVETTKTAQVPFPLRSSPSDVIAAYLLRKEQFKAMAEAAGARFIWGLQPIVHDKRALHDAERAARDPTHPVNRDDWRHVRARIPPLMRMVAAACATAGRTIVDVARAFEDLPAETKHFTDTIHLTPAGDEVVARTYFEHLVATGAV
jgi:hypothetical protein